MPLMRSRLGQAARNLQRFRANARERVRSILLKRIAWTLDVLFRWHDRLLAGRPQRDRDSRPLADRYSRNQGVRR
jgi:hypothetical protein